MKTRLNLTITPTSTCLASYKGYKLGGLFFT